MSPEVYARMVVAVAIGTAEQAGTCTLVDFNRCRHPGCRRWLKHGTHDAATTLTAVMPYPDLMLQEDNGARCLGGLVRTPNFNADERC